MRFGQFWDVEKRDHEPPFPAGIANRRPGLSGDARSEMQRAHAKRAAAPDASCLSHRIIRSRTSSETASRSTG